MDDPYKALGVARDASDAVIHRAYLKLAKAHHPDLNPGNKAAEERFKHVAAANDLLSDPEKRARYDRGEIDAAGQERASRSSYRDFAEGEDGHRYSRAGPKSGNWTTGSFNDLFGAMFDEPDQNRPRGGEDALYALDVSFLDAVNGATRRVVLADSAGFDVKIPPGTDEGQVLRLRGKAGAGANGGKPGDVLIEIHVKPHAEFHRHGQDILMDLPVIYRDAVLGGRVDVTTPGGLVRMRIPPRSDTGTKLRLAGRGVPAHGGQAVGDFIATLRLVLGPVDAALAAFLAATTPDDPLNPHKPTEATS